MVFYTLARARYNLVNGYTYTPLVLFSNFLNP